MVPEDLTHLPTKAIARKSMPHPSRCDHPETWTRNSGVLVRPNKHLKQKNAAIDAAPILANRLKIALPPQMLVGTKSQICPCFGHEKYQTTVRRLRPFLRRLAIT
jgi:hypothetical protein